MVIVFQIGCGAMAAIVGIGGVFRPSDKRKRMSNSH